MVGSQIRINPRHFGRKPDEREEEERGERRGGLHPPLLYIVLVTPPLGLKLEVSLLFLVSVLLLLP